LAWTGLKGRRTGDRSTASVAARTRRRTVALMGLPSANSHGLRLAASWRAEILSATDTKVVA